jgi:Cu/Zn superoxide dismutase
MEVSDSDQVTITGQVYFGEDVQDGLHGFHIHEFPADEIISGCDAAGGHFNPYNVKTI